MESRVSVGACVVDAASLLEEFSPELVRLHVKDYLCSLQIRLDEHVQYLKEEL
jgi:hypothetical protein